MEYLGATLSSDGSSTKEIRTWIAMATAAMARLSRIWKSNKISFHTKFRLYKSLVVSILLYGCESWTLVADTGKRLQAFENKCMRKLLQISYTEYRTNKESLGQCRIACWYTRTPADNRQTTETGLVCTHRQAQQSLQDHSSGHSGGKPTTGSTKEELVRERKGMDQPNLAGTACHSPTAKGVATTVC